MKNNKLRISIAGEIFSGKTTIAKLLASETKYNYVSMGGIFRDEAKRKHLTVMELSKIYESNPELDIKLDETLLGLTDANSIIVDGRMGWYFLKDSVKIYLKASQETKIERVLSANGKDLENFKSGKEAVEHLENRRASENCRYTTAYGVEIGNESNYDLVIDTTNKTVRGVLTDILEYLDGLE